MKVVIDTNQLHGDYLLQSPQFETLRDGLSQAGDELCLPEVVVKEITRHYLEAYARAISGRKKVNRIAGLVGNELPELEPIDIATEKYRSALQNRLEELHARVLEVPDIGADALLERDLAERRPFDAKGRGMRDTLIWESILNDIEKHDEDIALITDDDGFASQVTKKGSEIELHPDLADDLETAGYDRARVKVFKSVQEFNTLFFSKSPDKSFVEEDDPKGTFVETLDPNQMRDQFKDAEDEISRLLPWILRIRGAWDAEVSFLRWVGDAKIVEAFDLGDGIAHAILRAEALFDAKFRVDEDELQPMWRYFKDKTVWPSDMRWDHQMRVFRYKARVSLLMDIVYRWNLNSNQSEGAAILRFGFDEDHMQVM